MRKGAWGLSGQGLAMPHDVASHEEYISQTTRHGGKWATRHCLVCARCCCFMLWPTKMSVLHCHTEIRGESVSADAEGKQISLHKHNP